MGLRDKLFVLIFLLLLPLILVLVGIAVLCWFMKGVWLGLLIRLRWYREGKRVLFVYSDSPNWKEYIDVNILPKIGSQAVVLNWSERRQWDWKRRSVEFQVFRHWTFIKRYSLKGKVVWDGSEFNPIAITFVPWWWPRVFRFWQPFKDFKHGKEKPLRILEGKLFKVLNVAG